MPASTAATYSASVVEREMRGWSLLLHIASNRPVFLQISSIAGISVGGKERGDFGRERGTISETHVHSALEIAEEMLDSLPVDHARVLKGGDSESDVRESGSGQVHERAHSINTGQIGRAHV